MGRSAADAGARASRRPPGRRPDRAEFHVRHATAIVRPLTSNTRPWPSKVLLPDGLAVRGAVLTDRIRSVDRASRGVRRVGAVPHAVLTEIGGRVALRIGFTSDVAGPGDEA